MRHTTAVSHRLARPALSSVSVLALTVMMAAAPAQAGTYHATDDTSLRAQIANAEADADASGTIILDNDVTLSNTVLPGTTKPITIDTGSHTLTSAYKNGSTLTGAVNLNGTPTGSTYIFNGNIQAVGPGAGANGNGDLGLFSNVGKTITINGNLTGGAGGGLGGNGGTGAGLTGASSLTNTGTITGGGAVNGNGGTGVSLSTGASLTNSGAIKGGDGSGSGGAGVNASSLPNKTILNSGTIRGGNGGTAAGGSGVTVIQGNALDNSGTIIGGDGNDGGWGVNITGLNAANPIFTNSGTIRGGNGASGNTGAVGVIVRTNVGQMTNSGSITGGANSPAIMNTGVLGGTTAVVNLVNSGAITQGAGSDTAILMQLPSNLTLELRKGSVITGKVIGNTGAAANSLILGGDDNASFDVSTVGPQYQNFTSYQKTGNSVWTLTGAGSTATPWTIAAGTLQMGDGASMIGDVTNNATLAFTGSNTFANVITGTGGVTRSGTGTTILTGANSYTGLTNVTGGTLTVNGSLTGSALSVQNGGTMIINGTVTPSAVNAMAGLLTVNGALNSALTVQSGGTLRGNGTLGAATIQSGGTIAPGNSIGTLHINGAFTQTAGSIYQVEVDPTSSASDLIQVNGTATLQSGAGLNVTKNPAGEYQLGTVYRVLTASGGLSGTYAVTGETSGVSAFLGLRDSYDANNAYLTVVQTRNPVDVATTPNQTNVAQNLPDPIIPPVLNLPSDQAARSAFDQLSAQALSSAKGALVSNGLYVRDATLDRLRDVRCKTNGNVRNAACESGQPSLWAQGFGGWGGVTGNANASGVNRTTAGMLAGFDLPVADWRLGMFGGFSSSDFHLTGGPASGQSTDYHLGAYGGTEWDGISLSLGASYSWNRTRTDRSVAFGTFADRLQATYNAGATQLFAEAGYGMEMFGLTLEPFANLAYLNLRTDGFSEVGGAAALTARADTIENAITTFGVRPSTTVDLGSFPVTLRGMAGWRHTFGTVTPTSTVAFAGGSDFTISGAPIARDAMALEAGLDFALGDNISAGLTYGSQLSSRTTDQTARGTLRLAF